MHEPNRAGFLPFLSAIFPILKLLMASPTLFSLAHAPISSKILRLLFQRRIEVLANDTCFRWPNLSDPPGEDGGCIQRSPPGYGSRLEAYREVHRESGKASFDGGLRPRNDINGDLPDSNRDRYLRYRFLFPSQ